MPVPVPGFLIRLVLGEMSDMILGGSRVSPSRIMSSGFRFDHGDLQETLSNLQALGWAMTNALLVAALWRSLRAKAQTA